MARKDEAVEHLLNRKTPGEIASAMQISVKTVMGYLCQQVGEGKIRRSQILFSIPSDIRLTIKIAVDRYGPYRRGLITRALNKAGHKISKDDVSVYLGLRKQQVALGDMYDAISEVEILLHSAAERELEAKFGPNQWWDKCVPKKIKQKCFNRRQEDRRPADRSFSYTTLEELKDIYKKNWSCLSLILPTKFREDWGYFSAKMRQLNDVRRAVMHPAKGIPITEDDFHFVDQLYRELHGKVKGAVVSLSTLEAMTVKSPIQ